MKKHLFITGERNTGKSTVISNALRSAGITPAGFVTVRLPAAGGFDLHILAADDSDTPCEENRVAYCSRTGFVTVPGVFDTVGGELLERAAKAPLAVMDELGFLESGEEEFIAGVTATLDSPCRVLGVLKLCDAAIVADIAARSDVAVVTLTEQNCDSVRKTAEAFIADALPHNGQR